MKIHFNISDLGIFAGINFLLLTTVFAQSVSTPDPGKIKAQDSTGHKICLGYAEFKKAEITGSVYPGKGDGFNKGFLISPEELVSGRIPGLLISSESGKPGSAIILNNQRNTSFSTGGSPLILVNEIPVENLTLNPMDIETITFCSDASTAGVFGGKAGNGALLITTKKGSRDFKVNYSGKFSISSLPSKIDVFSADEFRDLIRERYAGDSAALSLPGNASTDWQDEIYRTAYGQDHFISVSGTVKNVPVRVSVGRTVQEGIMRTSKFDRTSSSISIDPQLFGNHLKISLNLSGNMNRNILASEDAIRSAIHFDPTQPVLNGSPYGGYFAWENAGNTPNPFGTANPVALLELMDNKENCDRWSGNLKMEYKLHFFPDLKIGFNYSREHSDLKNNVIVDSVASWTFLSGGGVKQINRKTCNVNYADFYLDYSKQFSFLSGKIDLTLGRSSRQVNQDISNYRATYGEPVIVYDSSTSGDKSTLHNIFTRLHFSLLEKYIFNFTLVRDSDSHFGTKNKTAFSPGFSVAWNIKNESFLKQVNFISGLKLFAGYTVSSSYSYQAAFITDISLPGNAYNYDANLKHEKNSTLTSGIDFSLSANLISGSFSFYKNVRSDIILLIPIASGSNFNNYMLANLGKIENKGFEFSLNTKLANSEKWFCEVGFNLSANKNKIISTGSNTGGIGGGWYNVQVQSPGYPVNSFFVLEQVFDRQGNPIENLYVDRSNQGGIISENVNNFYHYHKPAPDVLMGISSMLKYKQWEFSFSGRISLGNYVYNSVSSNDSYNSLYKLNYLSNLTTSINDTKFNNTHYSSDYYVENASYFRMDYMYLAYHFTDFFRKKAAYTITATAQNAFVITEYSGLDPEIYNGLDQFMYPRCRTFSIGINISL